jgi:hypothetical protein
MRKGVLAVEAESLTTQWSVRIRRLVRAIPAEVERTHVALFQSGTQEMIKNVFNGFEAMLRAVTFLLILVIGFTLALFGTYITVFLAYRMSQLLYDAIFSHRWLGP